MILVDLQYFPPITSVFTLINETDVKIDLYEPYRKMSFRNRCLIAGAQGIISLSIPLQEGRNQQIPVKDVLISNEENWQARHAKSIRSAYNRSPFFEHYADELFRLYNKPFKYLADWNLACLTWVTGKLNPAVDLSFTEQLIPFMQPGIDDRRGTVLPKNYMQLNPVRYRQVFEERIGFFPNLSILDLLFNKGKESIRV